jgi:hypothetical protein
MVMGTDADADAGRGRGLAATAFQWGKIPGSRA